MLLVLERSFHFPAHSDERCKALALSKAQMHVGYFPKRNGFRIFFANWGLAAKNTQNEIFCKELVVGALTLNIYSKRVRIENSLGFHLCGN